MLAPWLGSVKLHDWAYLNHFQALWQAFQIQAGRKNSLAPHAQPVTKSYLTIILSSL